ncbi:long-chain specific acyl-CoA dehydrogenase, mitochondrial [Acrasis kona]|uniref:Long-chain specific acyl-CoA dehydrogenase, mitochondrial n=1 Tax=Acrasis kona TaxID=1008807 RepID=A0AAW2YKA9_9EUKA
MTKTYTRDECLKHNKAGDCWVIIEGKVYDMSGFLKEHPGGNKVVLKVAGKDATKQFNQFHNKNILMQYQKRLYIGDIDEGKEGKEKTEEKPQEKSQVKEEAKVISVSGPPVSNGQAATKTPAPSANDPAKNISVSGPPVSSTPNIPNTSSNNKPKQTEWSVSFYGDQIPYGDPDWYQGWNTTYYNDSHKKFRDAMRKFVDENIAPHVHEWDEKKKIPLELYKKAYEAGILPGAVGAPWPTKYAGPNIAGGIKPEEFDYFHEMILVDELCRPGSGGATWGIYAGINIGLPPIIKFGSEHLCEKVAKPCLRGDKRICLAITEPYAGSDVANIQTTAKKTEDGKHYVVNGEKKWITNGVFCDFFTVAVRTGGAGMGGISMLVVERSKGVETRQMDCSGVWSSGTTYVTFDDVLVPVENLIGEENQGFKYIMHNFNHERFIIACQASRFARVCYEEAFKYAHKRSTFGKRLIDHPVIRLKLAHMTRQIESTHAWLESICHQLNTLDKKDQATRMAGPIALLKAQATQTLEFCAREASQIFGGLSYSRGGQGEKVERLYREVRAYAIPGGSEEIMLDLGIRQAMRASKL